MEAFLLLALFVLGIWVYDLQGRVRRLEQRSTTKEPESFKEPEPIIEEHYNETEEPNWPDTTVQEVAAVQTQTSVQPSLEERIGGNWFQWLGIGALVLAVLFFTQWSISNGYLGPKMQIFLAYVISAGGFYAGVRLFKTYGTWALTFCGGGMLAGFITTWVALHVYALVPAAIAFALFVGFTIVASSIAAWFSALPLAVFAVLGAFTTPVLTGEGGALTQLALYILILNAGVLYLAYQKNWHVLHMFSFGFTILWELYLLYEGLEPSLGIVFSILLLVVYWAVPVLYTIAVKQKSTGQQVVLTIANSLLHFGILFAWLEAAGVNMEQFNSVFTLLFGGLYALLTYLYYNKNTTDLPMRITAMALAIGYVTLAVPMYFGREWVALVWTIEAAFLFTIGTKYKELNVYRFGMILLPIAIVAYITEHSYFMTSTSSVLLYLALLGLIVTLATQYLTKRHTIPMGLGVLLIASSVVLVLNFAYTATDGWYTYSALQRFIETALLVGCGYYVQYLAKTKWPELQEEQKSYFGIVAIVTQIISIAYLTNELHELLRYSLGGKVHYQVLQFSTSILWAVYAGLALIIGFAIKNRFVRIFGGALLLITLAKLVFKDLWDLGSIYRIIGFTLIGLLLIGTSILYQNNKNLWRDVLGSDE